MKRVSAVGVAILGLVFGRPAVGQCPDGAPPPCRAAAKPASAPAANTIAVLYFDNLSRDTGDVYLADGLTEELISRLTQVERLQVKSRTVVQRLRDRPAAEPRTVGRALGVAHLVSGSVLRARGRLRVTVELTRVATGNSLWARSFDRPADDIIGIEAEIAESIAVNVSGRLAPAERRRIEARPTRSAEAYDHLLRARFEIARRTTVGILAAVHHYETALALDSMLTSAAVGVALGYAGLSAIYYGPETGMSRDSIQALARAALARAVRRDSGNPEVLLARALGRDPRVATPLLARAVALDPRNAEVHHQLGLTLGFSDADSAIAELKRALDIEPDRAITLVNLGQTYLIMRRLTEAQRWLDSAVAMRPEAAFYYLEQAFGRLLLGDTAGARASAPLIASHGSVNGREEILAMLEARRGDSAAARTRLEGVESTMRGADCFASHNCLELAMALAQVGARDRSLVVLERLRPRGVWLAYWTRRPEFDVIREDPRFQRLLAEALAAPPS